MVFLHEMPKEFTKYFFVVFGHKKPVENLSVNKGSAVLSLLASSHVLWYNMYHKEYGYA